MCPRAPLKKIEKSIIRPLPTKNRGESHQSVPSPQKNRGESHPFPPLKKIEERVICPLPSKKVRSESFLPFPQKNEERVIHPLP